MEVQIAHFVIDIGAPWSFRFCGFCEGHWDTFEVQIRWIFCGSLRAIRFQIKWILCGTLGHHSVSD